MEKKPILQYDRESLLRIARKVLAEQDELWRVLAINHNDTWVDEMLHDHHFPTTDQEVDDESFKRLANKFHQYIAHGKGLDSKKFVQLVVYFVITCPNIFDEDALNRKLFDGTYKGNERPLDFHDDLSLEITDWTPRPDFVKVSRSTTLSDEHFKDQYINPDNILYSRALFGIMSFNLIRLLNKRICETALNKKIYQRMSQLTALQPPRYGLLFDRSCVRRLQDISDSSIEHLRGLVNLVIQHFVYQPGSESDAHVSSAWRKDLFFDFMIREPLQYWALHIQRMLLGRFDDRSDLLEVENAIKEHNGDIIPEFERFKRFWSIHCSPFDSEDYYLNVNPFYRNKERKFWPYARVINPHLLTDLTIAHNRKLAMFALGLSEEYNDGLAHNWSKKFGDHNPRLDMMKYADAGAELKIKILQKSKPIMDDSLNYVTLCSSSVELDKAEDSANTNKQQNSVDS